MVYTTDYIISQVTLRTGLNASLVTTAQLIQIINQEMIKIISWLMESRKEYLIFESDFSYNTDNKYKIPSNAIGKKLRDVVLVRSNNFINLPIIQFDNIAGYNNGTGYYLKDNSLYIYPKETVWTDTLRMYYFRRPSDLTLVAESGVIQTVNPTTIVMTSTMAVWDSAPYGAGVGNGTVKFDVMDGTDQSVVKIAGVTGTRTAASATITMPTTGIVAGDIIQPIGYSGYSQLPNELNPLLIQSTCNAVYDVLNDDKSFAKGMQVLEKMFADSAILISPRDESDGQIISSNRNIRNYV